MVWQLFLVSVVAAAASDNLIDLAETDDLIETINNAQTTWTAGRNFPVGTKKRQVARLLGLKNREGDSVLPKKEPMQDENIEIPDSFDAREQWPHCHSVKKIKDQSDCGSCWAVAAAAAFSDRLCINTKGKFNQSLSGFELMSCCNQCGDGCIGGYPDQAWNYLKHHGIVTGGDYGSEEGCQPYPLQPCEHFMNGSRIHCPDMGDQPTPKCYNKCTNPTYKEYFRKDHHKTKTSYQVDSSVEAIQTDILNYGPVEAGFTVYEDFYSYRSGVYQHVAGKADGGHAVKVIGWGVEKDTPYWLVANSWNNDWGENGYFKIKRGTNECGFEKYIWAGIPLVK